MIRLFADFNKFIIPVNQVVLEKISDYPRSYAKIIAAIQNNQNLDVVVQHPTIMQWVKNCSVRYAQGIFATELLDARSALSNRWGLIIPADVTNEDIIQAKLLSLELQIQPALVLKMSY